jgi:hypothetical protein
LPRVAALLPAQQPPLTRGNEGCLLKKLEFAMATPLLDNIPLYRRRNTRSSTRKGGRGTGGGVAEQELMAFYPPTGKDRVKITRADWQLLGQYEMVNDTMIDFYLRWLMSIELKLGAFKTVVIEASVDGFKVSRASKFDDACDRRVLAPLRDGAAFLLRLPRVTALLPAQQLPLMAGSRGNEGCLLKKLEFAMATPLLDNIPLYRRRDTRSSTRKGGRGTGGGAAVQELMAFYPPAGKDRVKTTRSSNTRSGFSRTLTSARW